MTKTYIIAEVGPNHNGDLNIAIDMVKQLATIGIDAVKFQLAIPEDVYSKDAFKAKYQEKNENSKTPIEMAKRHQLSFEDHLKLYKVCQEEGVSYLCTAFDIKSLAFLYANTKMSHFKIPSGEIFSLDLLEFIRSKELPIILSTGMATFNEIETVLNILNRKQDITVLHCISNYPAQPEEVDLNVMLEIERKFGVKIGFSDHTEGNDAAIAAVALGATIIEKHVTYDKNAEGPDHKASATIEQFSSLVRSIRNVEKMKGNSFKTFSIEETEIKKMARKSIVVNKSLEPGYIIKREDLVFKRPGTGFLPIHVDQLIGKKIKLKIENDSVLKEENIS